MIDYLEELQELYTEISKLYQMKFLHINELRFRTSREKFTVNDVRTSLAEVQSRVKQIYDSLELLEYIVIADDCAANYDETTVFAKTPGEAMGLANEEFNYWYSINEMKATLKDTKK